ncbi:MAG: hypothetical protein J7K83_01015, partial [Candidatus Aenigmarchaeota archaeon]|nr:hypothetical protein [Candidatus Aenigmarchaeota archaeon]
IKEPPYISDLYYADIYNEDGSFSTWDTNNNGLFGEWIGNVAEDRDIDLNPDICVGRLPCRNRTEVRIAVNKIINYERNTFGKSWFRNVVAVAGTTHPEFGNRFEGEADLSETLKYLNNFKHLKLYASTNNLSRKNIIRAVNKGCGFFILSGHGNPPFWTTYRLTNGGAEWFPKFSTYHLNLLTNKDKLPICIANGCRNSAFDTSPVNLIKHPNFSYYWMDCIKDCWMWAIVKKPIGGAIASLGSTGIGYGKHEPITGGRADGWSFLIPHFFYEYKSKTNILGELWHNLIIKYLKRFPVDWNTPSLLEKSDKPRPDVINARTVQQFILFGDPTLKIGGYEE